MEKVCGICGEDCSAKPRVKDRRGRYFCKSCAMERAARGDDRAGTPNAGRSDARPESATLPIEILEQAREQKGCPVCMRTLPVGARICVSCGYDVKRGIQSSTLIEKTAGRGRNRKKRAYLCETCGYDLEGLPEPVCPECGTRVNTSRRARADRQFKAQLLHEEFAKPAVWFAIGFTIVGVSLAVRGEPLGFIAYAALLALQLPFMLVGLWICQKTFLGDIGTPLFNLVRLAGAVALGSAVDQIVPLRFFFLTPGLIVFWAVLMDLFEIDLHDAFMAGIVMGVLKIAGAIGALYLFTQVLGWQLPL